MKIRTQMILTLTGVALLPLFTLGLIAYHAARVRISDDSDAGLVQLAGQVAAQTDSFAYTALEGARTDGLIPSFSEFLDKSFKETPKHDASLATFLRDVAIHDPVNVTSVALLNLDGRKLVDTSPARLADDESQKPWVTSVLSGGVTVALPDFSEAQRPALWIGAPVRNSSGAIRGELRLRYELAALQQLVRRISPHDDGRTFAMIVSDSGQILAHGEDFGQVGAFMTKLGTNAVPSLKFESFSRHALATGELDRTATVSLQQVPWSVVIVETAPAYWETANELRNAMISLGALASVLCFGAAVIVSERLGRPIVQLASEAERIGRGDLTGDFSSASAVEASGEVATLWTSFAEMATGLRSARAEVEAKLSQLNESQETQRKLIDNSPVAMALLDRRGRFLQLNRAFVQLFGYDLKDLPDIEVWHRLAYPDPRYRTEMRRLWDSTDGVYTALRKHGREGVIVCKDGGKRLVQYGTSELGGTILTTYFDLTARKSAEDTLRESEERFRLLVENSNELVLQANSGMNITYASPNHAQVDGWRAEDLVGRSLLMNFHPEDARQLRQLLDQSAFSGTFRFRFKDGSWHWLESSGKRYTLGNGEERLALVSRDVTEKIAAEEARKRLEERLHHSQKIEAIGTLAGGIAHDFNNILTGIMGNTQLAEVSLPDEHPVRPLLSEALTASLRARDLVAQILTFSRRRDIQRAPTILGPVVREALQFLRSSISSAIEIKTVVDERTPEVLCDPTQIHQIVMNLGANAAHAMSQNGGVLQTSLAPVRVTPADIENNPLLNASHTVLLTVSDTGCGMDAQTVARIFEPFFTTKPVGEGTGLGLSVVHGIVETLEGAIVVKSTPERGTQFLVYLPGIAQAPTRSALDEPVVLHGSGQRILVIDDEPSVISVTVRTLAKLGYRASSCTDPAEAVALIRANPQDYDLIMTDLTMPGLAGTDVAIAIREIRADLPVLLATGNARSIDSAKVSQGAIAGFIDKPYTMRSLAEAVTRILFPS